MVNVAVGSIRQLRIDFGFSSLKVIATITTQRWLRESVEVMNILLSQEI